MANTDGTNEKPDSPAKESRASRPSEGHTRKPGYQPRPSGDDTTELRVKPALHHMVRFVSTLFCNAPPGRLQLRVFDDMHGGAGGVLASRAHLLLSSGSSDQLESLIEACIELIEAHPLGCFAPPVCLFWPRSERSTEQDVCAAPVLFQDFDTTPAASLKTMRELLGDPTIVVASGGRYKGERKLHGYWRLAQPAAGLEQLALHKEALQLMCAIVGSDPTATSCVHPMRWPGTVHAKNRERPALCEIVELNEQAMLTLDGALTLLRKAAPEKAAPAQGQRQEKRETGELVRRLLTGEELHATMVPLAMRLTRRPLDAVEAADVLRALLENADCPRDNRWRARLEDVTRSVSTAVSRNAEVPVAPSDDWLEHCPDRTAKGVLKLTTRNVDAMLRHCEGLVGLFRYNVRTACVELTTDTPPWGPAASRVVQMETAQSFQCWLEWQGFNASGSCSTCEGLFRRIVAHAPDYDPVVTELRAMQWDGVPRLDNWLQEYAGAHVTETQTPEYLELVGRWWLVSAVARAMYPGCEAHHVLVLEGAQGIGKSSLFRILGLGWSGVSLSDLGTNPRAAQENLQRQWICELDELAAVRRQDSLARLKAFVTSSHDDYRAAYARQSVSRPRRSVFGGSVNPDGLGYLTDSTGARRFWPVSVRGVHLERLRAVTPQLWAEAMTLLHTGARWYPPDDSETLSLLAQRAEEATEDDPLAGKLHKALKGTTLTTVEKVMSDILFIGEKEQLRYRHRVAGVLRDMGFDSRRTRVKGQRVRLWTRAL